MSSEVNFARLFNCGKKKDGLGDDLLKGTKDNFNNETEPSMDIICKAQGGGEPQDHNTESSIPQENFGAKLRNQATRQGGNRKGKFDIPSLISFV